MILTDNFAHLFSVVRNEIISGQYRLAVSDRVDVGCDDLEDTDRPYANCAGLQKSGSGNVLSNNR